MAKRPIYKPVSESEATISRLSNDLFLAREAIIALMSEEARAILNSHYRCGSEEESREWGRAAAEKIMDLCHPISQQMYQGHPIGSPRAKCPLCQQGANSFYEHEQGFAIPEGLLRHLLGTHNSRQCDVFGAAHSIAREGHWRKYPR